MSISAIVQRYLHHSGTQHSWRDADAGPGRTSITRLVAISGVLADAAQHVLAVACSCSLFTCLPCSQQQNGDIHGQQWLLSAVRNGYFTAPPLLLGAVSVTTLRKHSSDSFRHVLYELSLLVCTNSCTNVHFKTQVPQGHTRCMGVRAHCTHKHTACMSTLSYEHTVRSCIHNVSPVAAINVSSSSRHNSFSFQALFR